MIFTGCASEEELLELLELDEEEELELDELLDEDELELGRELLGELLALLELGRELLAGDELAGASEQPPSVPVTDTASAVIPAIFRNSRRFNSFDMTTSSCSI